MTTLIDRFKNPSLWFTIVAAIALVSIAYNNISVNSADIQTLDQRIAKKVEIQNELIQEVLELRLLMKDKEIEALHRHYGQQLEINKKHDD